MLLNDFNVVELKEIYKLLCDYWGLTPIKFYQYNKAALVQVIRDTELIIEKKECILVKFKPCEIKNMKPNKQNFRLRYGKYHNTTPIKVFYKPMILSFD
tara:strand:- start:9972 stop:10268 length:297 start_codon:yes stop_codon:yes gene_type:complete